MMESVLLFVRLIWGINMIVCYTDSENIIRLRWRDEEGNRKSEDVSDFRPYFFIKSD